MHYPKMLKLDALKINASRRADAYGLIETYSQIILVKLPSSVSTLFLPRLAWNYRAPVAKKAEAWRRGVRVN